MSAGPHTMEGRMQVVGYTRYTRLLSITVAALFLAAFQLMAPPVRAQVDSTKTSAPDSTKTSAAGTTPAPDKVPTANHLYDKFQIDMSLADVLIGPNIRVDNQDGSQGTDIGSGSVLGIDRSGMQTRIAVTWRPGHRHELELGYLTVDRSGEKRIEKDVTFRDTTFTAGLNVNTELGASNAYLSYRFAFTAKEKTQIGAELALGAIFFKFDLNALAGASNGNDTLTTSYGASGKFPGPTAAVGLYGRFRLGEKWYLSAGAGGMGATVENITISVVEAGTNLRYFINNRFGLEAGYGLTQVKFTIDKDGSGGLFDPSIQGSIKYPFQNIRIGVVAAFQ